MKTKTLNTEIFDGMYMDIHSIEFKYDLDKLKAKVVQVRDLLKKNSDFSSISIDLFSNSIVVANEYFDSTNDDDERTNEVDSRIDTELLSISNYGVYYRGYSKWSSDFLEVDLGELLT